MFMIMYLLNKFREYVPYKNIKDVIKRGQCGLFNTLDPKFYNNVFFSICWLNNFGDFSEFLLVGL